jgi:hypothetical protein
MRARVVASGILDGAAVEATSAGLEGGSGAGRDGATLSCFGVGAGVGGVTTATFFLHAPVNAHSAISANPVKIRFLIGDVLQ